MISLQESIIRSIRNWPTLFGCRTDVLYQYFCVIGNGLDWVDGGLFDRYGDSTAAERASMLADEDDEVAVIADRLATGSDDAHRLTVNSTTCDAILAQARIRIRRRNAEVAFRIDNADLLARLPWRFDAACSGLEFCANPWLAKPITQLSAASSAMFTVPDDVAPDWLAGVREMIFAVFQAPPPAPRHRLTARQCQEQHDSTIALAGTALAALHRRFPVDGLPSTLAEWQASAGHDSDAGSLFRRLGAPPPDA